MKCHALFSLKNHVLKDKMLTTCIAAVTGALRVFNHCASVVSYKMDNIGHHKVIHYLGHKGSVFMKSQNTWWSHYDMVKKCTVEFSRENLEDNPPSKKTNHHRLIGDDCHPHCRQMSNIVT